MFTHILFLTLVAAISLVTFVQAEVTILPKVQTIYGRSPKLRIRGSGFDADEHSILLELSAPGQPSLRLDKDYLITKDDDGLILKLLGGRKWVDFIGRTPPVSLVLTSVKFLSDPEKNLLPEPIILAQVLPTPTVVEMKEVIYTTATNELRINGTGFVGAKKVDLYFNPPLYKGIDYEDVSKFPLSQDQVVLRIRHGYKWRSEPGPLSVLGVDTGGGPAKVGDDDGVLIAEVQADLDLHGVTVETTASQQFIYHDEHNIMINGAGFNPQGNTLRFANGILGKGINFTTVSTAENSISLRLTPGSFWRENGENLPGYLTLLAVNAGEGFVAVGPTNAAKGRDVATVFERPQVFSGNVKLFRTHSHELHIHGAGFPKIISKPQIKFSPALVEGVDYTVRVLDRTDMEVTLLDGRSWRSDTGPLLITDINTRGDEAGWVSLPGEGVHVAEIIEDVDSDTTGGVEIFPMGVKVYQSVLQETIVITGSGFKEGISFVFEPDLRLGSDYDMDVQSKNKILLKLRSKKTWRKDPGFIIAKSVKIANKVYPLAGNEGIRVAVVLADPLVNGGKDTFHETQSKVIAIQGRGFTNVADTKVIIRPTSPGAYKILAVLDDTIRVQLRQGYDWLPSYLSLKDNGDESQKIPLQVTSIDTGAGEVVYDDPVTVGYIIKDREGVVCDDSCEFAFDGVCDDGSEDSSYYYYESEFNYYLDDDLGGYYSSQDGNSYGVAYDDYYMEDDGYRVSACVEGTDCTDCGGVDAVFDYTVPPDPESGVESCSNSCPYARDGVCDDPRGANYCKLGTDCQDCGPLGADNFTKADDDGWWDDDDDYWTFNDGNFLEQTAGLDANRHRVKVFTKTDSAGPAAMFLVVLEGMVYTVGAIFAAAALYLGIRWYNNQSIPFLPEFDPEVSASKEFELAPTKRMPITPDVIRT